LGTEFDKKNKENSFQWVSLGFLKRPFLPKFKKFFEKNIDTDYFSFET